MYSAYPAGYAPYTQRKVESRMEIKKYYCCDSFDSWSWKHLIKEVLPNSQFVEFNQLFLMANVIFACPCLNWKS